MKIMLMAIMHKVMLTIILLVRVRKVMLLMVMLLNKSSRLFVSLLKVMHQLIMVIKVRLSRM